MLTCHHCFSDSAYKAKDKMFCSDCNQRVDACVGCLKNMMECDDYCIDCMVDLYVSDPLELEWVMSCEPDGNWKTAVDISIAKLAKIAEAA
jgi:hypothetical protein